MKKSKSMKAILIGTAISLFLAACGGGGGASQSGGSGSSPETSGSAETPAAAPIELKLGTRMPETSVEGQGHLKFAELVEEKSNGELIVHVYAAEQLGKGLSQIDNVLMGVQDMFAEGAQLFAEYDRRLDLNSIPYLFRDFEHYAKFNRGEVGQEIHQNLAEAGLRVINTERNFVRGPYRVLLSTKPIRSLEDVQGLKLRSFESKIYTDSWKYLGANPTVVAWTETYLALKQNVVEAVTSPISSVSEMKFAEVAPYMTVIEEFPQDVLMVMNEEKFQSLSEEHRNILIEAANEAGAYASELSASQTEADIEKMKEENGLEVIEIDKGPWLEKIKPYFYELEASGDIPEGIVDQTLAIE